MGEIAIGIDLGTSNSCVAVRRGDSVDVVSNAYGENTTASVVFFEEDGSIRVGNAAKAGIIHDPVRTISSAKRLIGRYYFSQEVKKAKAICSYEIVDGDNHGVLIQVGPEKFTLPEISAMVLREMKSIAEAQLGQPVAKAVITVPAYFNDNQRQATKDAGRIAGLEVLRILNEPTAAALAYGFGKGLTQRVAVWDLGGGTFDISVLEIGDDVFEVLATCGDTFLGGDDFDDRIIDLLADEFSSREGINLRNDPYSLEKLKVAAEGAKKGLSVDDEVEISIPDIAQGEGGSQLSIQRTITSQEFGTLVNDLIQRSFKVCDEALQQAGVVARDLDGVILVGGPTRLPLIREAVSAYFQQEPKADVDPDEVVAMGAAIHAASLVDPDREAYLLDVTPLSLRIGVAGGLAETVIERNTPVPIEQTRTFTTFTDFQESVDIRVYQGESRNAQDNEMLGQFVFSGFEKAKRGEIEIDVTFEINADGIVDVRARDRGTGEEASTRLTLSAGLSEGEIEKIIESGRTDRVETAVAPSETERVAAIVADLTSRSTQPEFEAQAAPAAPSPSPAPVASQAAPPNVIALPATDVVTSEPAPAPVEVAAEPEPIEVLAEPDSIEITAEPDLEVALPAEEITEPVDGDIELSSDDEGEAQIELEVDVAAVAIVEESIPGLEHGPGSGEPDEDLLPEPDELIALDDIDDIDDAELIDVACSDELTDDDHRPTDPAIYETEPNGVKNELFETPGTDLSADTDDEAS